MMLGSLPPGGCPVMGNRDLGAATPGLGNGFATMGGHVGLLVH